MSKNNKKDTEKKIGIESLSPEVMKDFFAEQQAFINDVFDYKLEKVLDDVSQPLTMKEKNLLKKYDLMNVDAEKDFDGLIMELSKIREVPEDTINEQSYSELSLWVRKVIYGTFNLKKAAKK